MSADSNPLLTVDPALQGGDGSTFLEVLNLLLSRWRSVLLAPLLAGALTFGATFLMKNQYTATASFLPPTQNSPASALLSSIGGSLGGLGSALTSSLGVKSPADQWMAILASRTIADEVIEKYHLKNVYGANLMKDARETLASRTDISSDKSGLIRLDVDDEDPNRAAQMANDYVAFLTKLAQDQIVGDAMLRRQFYEKQLASARANLAGAQARLAKSGVAASTLKMEPDAAVAMIAQLKAQIAAQEIQLSVLSQSMTPNNVLLQQSSQTLAELRSQLARMEAANKEGTPSGGDYTEAYRQFKYAETMYELMAKQYELARIDETGGVANVQVIDIAIPPEKQSKPRRVLLSGLVALAGILIMSTWVLMSDAVRRRRSDPAFDAQIVRLTKQLRRPR